MTLLFPARLRLLPAFVLVLGSLAAPALARQTPLPAPVSVLPMTDAAGVPVTGIVCDNLPDTPPSQRDCLVLTLPAALHDVPVDCALAPPETKQRLRHPLPAEVLGTITREGDRLIYTPPLELNTRPSPRGLRDIDRMSRRTVFLSVRIARDARSVVARQSIVLARTPLVMVHGINASATSANWAGKSLLVGRLPRYGVTPILVNHGLDDFDHRHPAARPALDFRGNGPVEHAAQQLAETVAQTLQTVRDRDHLAIRRVDLIGYSYGGVISRWYLHSFRRDPRCRASATWYTRSTNSGDLRGLYQLDSGWYARQIAEGEPGKQQAAVDSPFILPPSSFPFCPIRKFITIASMWRGVPLCNYANEIHATQFSGPQLRQAPILGGALGYFVDGTLAAYLPTRVPAIEVMGVNSPWLAALDGYEETGQPRPFLESVAYGCVAGDDSTLLGLPGFADNLFDPYATIRAVQVPSWFPYFALESRSNSDQNFSDGLVPLWSAVISDNFGAWQPSRIVGANHDTILADSKTLEYVLCALNHSAWLPSGSVLNARWNLPVSSRELLPPRDINAPDNSPIPAFALDPPTRAYVPDRAPQIWKFRPGEMAPTLQNELYLQINRLARIAPAALREIRDVRIDHLTRTGAQVSWRTAATLGGAIRVLQWRQVNFAAQEDREAPCSVVPIGTRITREHHFEITGLEPNSTYKLIATSEAFEGENVVSVGSGEIQFRTLP